MNKAMKEKVRAAKSKIGLEFPHITPEEDLVWAMYEAAIDDLTLTGKRARAEREDALAWIINENWVSKALGIDPSYIARILVEIGLITKEEVKTFRIQ